MSEDLHTHLRTAIEERLSIARSASPGPWNAVLDDRGHAWINVPGYAHAWGMHGFPDEARHVALHHPADAIRRYEAALQVLERHAPVDGDRCAGCFDSKLGECMPLAECPEVADIADSLGIEAAEALGLWQAVASGGMEGPAFGLTAELSTDRPATSSAMTAMGVVE